MQTPVNSLGTTAVTSAALERDPSFLRQLQNNHVGQSFAKQLSTKQDQKKVIIKQSGCPKKKKKIVFFIIFPQVYFQMGGVFFPPPSHAHPGSSLRGSEGWWRQGSAIGSIVSQRFVIILLRTADFAAKNAHS